MALLNIDMINYFNVDTSPRTPSVQIGAAEFSLTVIIVCVLSSISFLIIGYACGWFNLKHIVKLSCTSKARITDPAKENACHDKGSQHPQILGPLYEELHQESILEHRDDLVELQENVAYGPIAK